MSTIIFTTGNKRKVQEATETLEKFGLEVVIQPVDIDEIQHKDPAEIAKAKARAAYDVVHAPVVVQDTSWGIPALRGFPGGYMKDTAEWLTAEDWMAIMSRHDDKTILCFEHVVYFDGENLQHFQSHYQGAFVSEPRGTGENSSIERVVSMFDDKTMAEMHDTNQLASAGANLDHWIQFAEWYVHTYPE